jgi:transposase-like protein
MPHQMLTILWNLNEIAKKNQTGPVACHWCNNQDNIIKYGTYQRCELSGDEQIRIQRFLCKHDRCRRTFSILPHPFLRISRFSLCMIAAFLQLMAQKISIAKICRQLGLSRTMAYWAIENGRDILDWIDREAKTEPTWAPFPCIDPPGHWSEFIRMFAMKFYPKRYAQT